MKNKCRININKNKENTKQKIYKKQWNIDKLPSKAIDDRMRNLR